MNIIYEINDSFPVDQPPSEATKALVDSFTAAGFKPRVDSTTVTVKTGSNLWLRLWGTMLPWGRMNVPVGITVTLEPAPNGSVATVHAYDRLGWYLDAQSNSVLRDEAQERIADLSRIARESFHNSEE